MSELIAVEVICSDIKPSFPKKLSLKILSVLGTRSGQVLSGREGFQSYRLSSLCFESTDSKLLLCFQPLLFHCFLSPSWENSASATLPQRTPQGSGPAISLSLLGAYSARSEAKTHWVSPSQCHSTRSIGEHQLYLCILWKALVSWSASCATQELLYPTTTLHFCNTCPLQTSGCETRELVSPHYA